ncbi:MAG: hypothetical protein ABIA11_00825 [Patescibacteria group bacterium]|nr:hypothetical protein [Patescibacteria group bacterium]
MNKSTAKKLIALVIFASFMFLNGASVYANYGGGEVNKRFKITKQVRLEGDNSWKDKVTNVKEGEVIEFRITVENLSDEEADEFDNMKIEDFLPDELFRVGGSGLTEYWDNFGSGEEKKFTIEVKVEFNEYDRDITFEKCIVNKVELEWDGEFEGSDTATVCYGNEEPSELPKTGYTSTLAIAGLATLVAGLFAKKFGR